MLLVLYVITRSASVLKEIGLEERLQYDLFSVEWDVKP